MTKLEMSSGQALKLWHEVTFAQVTSSAIDLTQRQMAILLIIYLTPPPHTVRALAQKLNVTKPVITRALNSMGAIKLVDRKRDEKDLRNVIIQRTVEGANYLENLATMISTIARDIE